LPVDVEHYSSEQIESLEAIAKMVETKQAKNFKDAGGLYRKIQNEAQLKEIADRYSLGDRIPEITSALKLKPETITDEQFEQFREVCEQVQRGMELPMAAQGVMNKAKAKPQPETGNASASTEDNIIASVAAASNESAIAKKRAHPGLAVQDNAPSWRPSRDVKAIQLAESEMKEAAKDIAQAVSGAPFGGINDAVDYADSQIKAIRGEWSDAVFDQVEDELNSDEISFFLEKTYVGKRRKLSGN
jgi:hypothetical protein